MGLLRILLALSVLLAHTRGVFGYKIVGGDVAVQCFYIVSGFYMALVLNEKYQRPSDNALFYSNRFLRVFSIYWLFLVVAVALNVLAYFAIHDGVVARMVDATWPVVIGTTASNILIFGQDIALFLKSDGTPYYQFMFLPQAWSLSLELTFYLIAPFVVRRGLSVIIAVAFASLLVRAAGYLVGLQMDPWLYRFFPFELSLFMCGAISYKLYVVFRQMEQGPLFRALGVMPIAAILLYPLYGGASVFFDPARIGLLALLTVTIPAIHLTFGSNRLDRLIGELSYPLYLCHLMIASVLAKIRVLGSSSELLSIGTIVVSVIASWLAVRYVDMPIDAYRQRRAKQIVKRREHQVRASALSANGLIGPGLT